MISKQVFKVTIICFTSIYVKDKFILKWTIINLLKKLNYTYKSNINYKSGAILNILLYK